MMKTYKKVVALIVLMVGLMYSSAYSQVAGWSAFGVGDASASLAASLVNENLIVSDITLGGGLGRGVLGNGFGAVQTEATADFPGEGGGRYGDQAEQHALDRGQYFEFDVTAKPNYTLSLSALTFKIRISQEGRFFLLQYKVGTTGTFKNAAPRQQYSGAIKGNGVVQPAINLSGIPELSNIAAGTKVTFRLYYGGSTNTSTVTALGASASDTEYALSVSGDLIPEQSIVGWQFGTPTSIGNELTYNASFTETGLDVSALVRGPGLRTTQANGTSPITYPGAFVAGATTATTAVSAADIADAITNDLYFAFDVKPSANYKVSLSKLRAKVRASSGGAKTWLWRYSTDNVNFTDLGAAYYNPNTATGGVYMPEIDLTPIAILQNILPTTTVYFRLYLQGSNNDTGSSGIGISVNENAYMLSLDGTIESTLPVKLTTFTGKNNGNNVLLNWKTASERNSAYFEVLRIKQGQDPLVLGVVQSKGTTNEQQSYSFTDTNPVNGTNYYQLRQVDDNGNTELSDIIPVKSGLTQQAFNAFFNGDVLNISFTSENTAASHLLLTDLSGRIIYRKQIRLNSGQNLVQVPVAVQSGIYVATLANQSSTVISKKIVKL